MKPRPPSVRVCRPPPHLAVLVRRPGGLLRETAIARGQQKLEGHKAPAQAVLQDMIARLEAMTQAPLSPDRVRLARRQIDSAIALAETFGLEPLAEAAKRLSELLRACAGVRNPDVIAVHIRAMRLFAAPGQEPGAAASVIAELDRVLAHVGGQAPQR